MLFHKARCYALAVLTAGSVVLTLAPSGASEDRPSQRDEMLQMFDAIPDIEDLHNFYPIAIYMDIGALEDIHGFEAPFATERDPKEIGEELGRWSAIHSRFVVNPIDLPPYVLEAAAARMAAEAEEAASGLPAVFAIDRALVVGWRVLADDSYKAGQAVLAGYGGGERLTDPDDLEAALNRRGFVRRKPGGRPLWSRSDDQAKPELDDLMGRVVSTAKEVSLVGDHLMVSPLSGAFGHLFSSSNRRLGSLADDRDVRALLEALTDRERLGGSLLQSWFYEGAVTIEMATHGSLGPYVTEEQRRLYAERLRDRLDGALPAYRWFAAAELQEGDEELLVFALTYEDLASAERAAQIVARRFPLHRSIQYKQALREVFPFRTESRVHVAEAGDRAVALVTLRHDYPPREEIDRTKHGKFAKAIFADLEWQRLIPLVVNPRADSL